MNGFKFDWMAVLIPILNGFVQRLVLYKTIENSNIKIKRKILLFIGKILIVVRTRYSKVESENKKMFFFDNLTNKALHLHGNISKIPFFHLNFFSKMNT